MTTAIIADKLNKKPFRFIFDSKYLGNLSNIVPNDLINIIHGYTESIFTVASDELERMFIKLNHPLAYPKENKGYTYHVKEIMINRIRNVAGIISVQYTISISHPKKYPFDVHYDTGLLPADYFRILDYNPYNNGHQNIKYYDMSNIFTTLRNRGVDSILNECCLLTESAHNS